MDIKEIRERIEYALSTNPQMVMDGKKKSGDPSAIDYNYKMVLRQVLDALSTIDPEAIKKACADAVEEFFMLRGASADSINGLRDAIMQAEPKE